MKKKVIYIRKSSGELVPFNSKKIITSITRTGADEETANKVLAKVKKQLKDHMSTKEIYQIVRDELANTLPWAGVRYDLREAIIKLGPAGYNFEKYVAAVLSAYGYKTATPDTYKGACIEHEIDVTAEKDGRTAFIEAKFRHDFRSRITIKDTMATWARFLDLVDGSKIGLCPHFDEVWILTNARFTDQSLQYGHCKNMKLVGWKHPEERTFAQMVDINALYPITILKDIKDTEIAAFVDNDLILCREIMNEDPRKLEKIVHIKEARLRDIIDQCNEVVHHE